MRVSLFLSDAAQADAQSGKVHALGLGWRQCQTPTPPFALVLFLDIDWDETNKQHQLKCQLLTADGDPVVVPGPHGPQRILFEAAAEAGRAPGAIHGTSVRMPLPSTFLREFPWNQESTSGAWRSKVTSGPRRSKHLSWPAGATRRRHAGRVDRRNPDRDNHFHYSHASDRRGWHLLLLISVVLQ